MGTLCSVLHQEVSFPVQTALGCMIYVVMLQNRFYLQNKEAITLIAMVGAVTVLPELVTMEIRDLLSGLYS